MLKTSSQPKYGNLFNSRLDKMINLSHPLVRLAGFIPWAMFDEAFGKHYRPVGRPAKPMRLMVGLNYLKHTYNLSDEEVVVRWIENPYWQFFCGCEFFSHELPIDASTMTRWRKRIGPEGMEFLLKATVSAALESGSIKPNSLERLTVDTTVQPKAIAYPTDGALMLKAIFSLVNHAKKKGVDLRQAYTRLAKKMALMVGRYAHARQFKRMRKALRSLKTYLGRLYRDISRKIAGKPDLEAYFSHLLSLCKRLLDQKRTDKNKLYALHAPEVLCISKGKARTPYEFGCKVALAVTNREGLIVASRAFSENSYDGHTLSQTIEQAEKMTGVTPERIYADRGYRGHSYEGTASVFISGQKRGITPTIKRELKRRSAIEAVIGHSKTDGRLGRNYLLGVNGDSINALLVAAGTNLRMILRVILLCCACFLSVLWAEKREKNSQRREI